jgi:hypothetical protein
MSLTKSVARAIRDTPYPHRQQGLTNVELDDLEQRRAAAAIRVCMAEAQQAVEALPEGLRKGDVRLADVLAALAALAEEGQ